MTTFKQIVSEIDPINPPKSLRNLLNYYREIPNNHPSISLRKIWNLHNDVRSKQIKFLYYNTYLMGVDVNLSPFFDNLGLNTTLSLLGLTPEDLLKRLGIEPPSSGVPDFLGVTDYLIEKGLPSASKVLLALGLDLTVRVSSKPALEARAIEIGTATSNLYDLMALCEVWQADSKERVLKGWTNERFVAEGPILEAKDSRNESQMGSGLLAISKLKIINTESVVFKTKGVNRIGNLNHLVDLDSWAKKSVLLTEVDVGVGAIEIYTTHFYSGGDALNIPLLQLPKPTENEKIEIRNKQIDEFVSFFHQTHKKENVAIFCGDLNISGNDGSSYDQLKLKLGAVNFEDIWSKEVYNNDTSKPNGQTNRKDPDVLTFDYACKRRDGIKKPDDDNPGDYYCDDLISSDQGENHGDRIDYIFVEKPSHTHNFILNHSRLLRRPFLRKKETDGQLFLSDHMGLELTIFVSPKN
jgi:hypothetical protein